MGFGVDKNTLNLLRITQGGQDLCLDPAREHPGIAIVHCCKYPCFVNSERYHPPETMIREHVRRDGDDIYINMIDPSSPLFYSYLFTEANRFIEQKVRQHKRIIIHCNVGVSRSPSVLLVALAHLGYLPRESYDSARAEFDAYRGNWHQPGLGIEMFLREHWGEIISNEQTSTSDAPILGAAS